MFALCFGSPSLSLAALAEPQCRHSGGVLVLLGAFRGVFGLFWRFWWACGPCGLLASLGRSWVLGVLLGRVLVLRKCIPNVSMQQVCLEAHHTAIGVSAHVLVDAKNQSIAVGMGCTTRARQASPGRPQIVLSVMIQINQPPSRQQRANHRVLLRLLLQQQLQATILCVRASNLGLGLGCACCGVCSAKLW